MGDRAMTPKVRQKPRPKHAPKDAVSVADAYRYLAYLMDNGYQRFPVMWSAGGVFGYVRAISDDVEPGEYHRGVTFYDRRQEEAH